nr:hypothetical protein Iba_chr13bCG13460 [Ipomoea batatas]
MGEMLGRSNLIDDIDLNALIVEDYIQFINSCSSCFDGDHDDLPDGCNPSAGGGGTSTDANEDDSSIPDGCNPYAGGGGTFTDANEDDLVSV